MNRVGVILARFQPIHNGHLELIRKAVKENDKVLIFIGSVDKMNERNPIPWKIRHRLVIEAIGQNIPEASTTIPIKVVPLKDLTDEKDNSHDWGFYLFANMVKESPDSTYTMYYSDGYEIITSWFPGFILYDHINLSLLARGACEQGVSATMVRQAILNNSADLFGMVPENVYKQADTIKSYLEVFQK